MNKAFILAIFCVGFSGLTAQMILMRELLVVFSGNELTIGIILANWLILEAGGCYFPGRLIGKNGRILIVFVWTTILFSTAIPAIIYLTRIAKPLLGIAVGEETGFPVVLLVSFLTLLPASVLHGASFTLACRMHKLVSGPKDSFIGKVYVWETLGTLSGGIAFTFLIIPHLNSFQMAAVLASLNAVACLFLLVPQRGLRSFSDKAAITAAGLLLATVLTALFSNWIDALHYRSVKAQWGGQNVVHYQNSIYGNVCVVKSREQYVFFMDGAPSIMTPVPDIGLVEQFVHIPLLAHASPEKILVLSGGAGGVLNEILKHESVEIVDYAELNPLVVELMKKFPTALTKAELASPRVEVKHVDGRLFLRTTQIEYDIIMTGLSGPEDLQANRFYTREFFSLADRKLRKGGIIIIKMPGSFVYMNEELRNLNAVIYYTMKSVFPYVRAIPGDGTNFLLASQSDAINKIDASLFAERLTERELTDNAAMPWHIEQKLHPEWQVWFADFIADGTERVNYDFQPLGVFYNVAYWNSLLTPALRRLFTWSQKLRLSQVVWVFAFAIGLICLFRHHSRRLFGSGIPLCTATTGFAGMVFDLTLLFAFQSVYGYVFSWMGFLVAGFMAGAASGGLITNSKHISNEHGIFIKIDLVIIGFAFGLSLAFSLLQPYLDIPVILQYTRWVFLVILFFGGMLTGAQFPLANRLYLKRDGRFSRTAGLLYGADLLGGWFGGIASGVILLPILGLSGTCVTVGLIKLTSFVILVLR